MELKKQSLVSRKIETLASGYEDETVMINIENGMYYGLDPVASRIWEIVAKPVAVSDLIDILLAEFDVSHDRCKQEVVKFLSKLEDQKLLKVSDEYI